MYKIYWVGATNFKVTLFRDKLSAKYKLQVSVQINLVGATNFKATLSRDKLSGTYKLQVSVQKIFIWCYQF